MEDLTYIAAVVAVAAAGIIIVRKVASCLWNMVVTVLVLAVLYWGLRSIGVI